MRNRGTGAVTGEQFTQVNNPDPFAPPVWRSPVHRTPEWVIWLVQLVRLLGRVVWFVICHPGLDMAAALVILGWLNLGWPGSAPSSPWCSPSSGWPGRTCSPGGSSSPPAMGGGTGVTGAAGTRS